MPTYTVRDPQSGRTLRMTGDEPPTEQEITKAFLDAANATPLAAPSTYGEGFRQGAMEGVAGGARGFIEGLANASGDMARGVRNVMADPLGSARSAIEGLNPIHLARRLPLMLKDTAAAMEQSRTDPESWGRPIGSQVGQLALTAAPGVVPGMAQAAGRGIQRVGQSPALRWAATYRAVGSGMTGNILGAVGAATVPAATRAIGRGIETVGRGAQAVVEAPVRAAGRILEARGPAVGEMPTALMPRPHDIPWGSRAPVSTPAPTSAGAPSSAVPAPTGTATPPTPAPTPLAGTGSPHPDARILPPGPFGTTIGVTETGESLQGFPRILNRAEGAMPTPAEVAAYRAEMGVKDAASELRLPRPEIERLAPRDPNTPVQLPRRAQRRIEQRLAGMTPEEQAAYLRQSPHELSSRFIQDALSQALRQSGSSGQ